MCLDVEPVSNVLPHAKRTLAKLYWGWSFSFMGSSSFKGKFSSRHPWCLCAVGLAEFALACCKRELGTIAEWAARVKLGRKCEDSGLRWRLTVWGVDPLW